MGRTTLHDLAELGAYHIRAPRSVRVEVGEPVIRAFRQRIREVAYDPQAARVDLPPINVRHTLLLQRLKAASRHYKNVPFALLTHVAPASAGPVRFHFLFWLHPLEPTINLVMVIRCSAWKRPHNLLRAFANPIAWPFGRAAWVMRRAHNRLTRSDNYVPPGNPIPGGT
ncbi:MAG: hypothetical protein JNM80_12840 [Phycisphaerae bacterium]|nr:hypothetical protein [Phycisphaerae bacterium]